MISLLSARSLFAFLLVILALENLHVSAQAANDYSCTATKLCKIGCCGAL